MKSYRAALNISAETDVIWRVLTDASRYEKWDPELTKLEGKVAKGKTLLAYMKAKPKRPVKYVVTDLTPGITMTWRRGVGLFLYQGVRTVSLSRNNDATVEFTIQEDFGGMFVPLMGKAIPDLSRTFRLLAAALKERCESGVEEDSIDRVIVRE